MMTVEEKPEVKKVTKIEKLIAPHSFQAEFKQCLADIERKYGFELFNISGIGNQLDMNWFAKQFFGRNTNTADVSVDSNSNVGLKNTVIYDQELSKPFKLIGSYYRMWKGLKKKFGLEYANKATEKQLTGEIYINDFHGFQSNLFYSYYGKTVVTIKYRGAVETITLDALFDRFAKFVEVYPDRETINLSKVNIYVLDKGNKFVKLTHVLRHRPHNSLLKLETKNGMTTIVTEDHPVILADGTEKQACEIVKGDRLMMSDCTYDIFDSDEHEIDRTKYIVGFAIGDGFLTRGSNDTYSQVSVSQKNIGEHKIYQYICEESPNTANTIHPSGYGNRQEAVVFGDRCWVCKNANIGKKAHNKCLPSDILNWNRVEILSLIAGLIDSDGCVNSENGVVDIRICGYAVVQQVAELLRALGFERVRTSHINLTKRMGSFGSNYDLFRVSFVVNDMDLIKFSDKLTMHKDVVLRERGKDGRFETNEVLKIMPLQQELPEFVYDITTETGHFHCQGMIQHNCYNYSTLDTAHKGIPKGIDAEPSRPTKYLGTFLEHLQLFCIHAGSSSLGAVGLADLLLTISCYVARILDTHSDHQTPFGNEKIDELAQIIGKNWGNASDDVMEEIKNFINMQSQEEVVLASDKACWTYVRAKLRNFIYFLNQPNRIVQSLFSNVSIYDDNFLDTLLEYYFIEDKTTGKMYFAEKEIVKKLQVMFIDIMNEVMSERIVTFPVVTACFSLDEDRNIQEEDFLRWVLEADKKFRFINLYAGATSTLSSCCRLRSDKTSKYTNSLGSGSTKIGSLGVTTQNLPRLAFMSNGDMDSFKEMLRENIMMSQRINGVKRSILKKAIDKNMIPVYNLGYVLLNSQFQTTGVVGIYEALQILGYDIKTPEGEAVAEDILKFINAVTEECADEQKVPCNVEQIPAENVAVKLAKKDRLLGFNDRYDIYSNQYVPLKDNECDMFTRIRLVAHLDKYMSGGSILHININEGDVATETLVEMAKTMYKQGVVYFAFNKLLAECVDCGHVFTTDKETFDKNEVTCPICASKNTECALRIVGFIRKFSSWSSERQAEGRQRKFYTNLVKGV